MSSILFTPLKKHYCLLAVMSVMSAFFPASVSAATSTNITVVYPPGNRMVSNPLLSTNNDVSNLFQNPPAFLTLFKRNGMNSGYDVSSYDPDLAAWTAPMSLVPGEGAFLSNPSGQNYTNTFYGEMLLCSTNTIPTGYTIRSQVLPTTKLTSYPVSILDALFFLTPSGGYNVFTYDPEVGWVPFEPTPMVGEAFWIAHQGPQARLWLICVSAPWP